MSTLRVVHYLNQFFAGVGAEDKADTPPGRREGAVGPGLVLQQALGDRGQIVATVWCGDNYANEQPGAVDALVALIAAERPDLLVAGPAFAAGRYGLACGAVCLAVQERLGIPTVAGMDVDNTAAELYRTRVLLAASGDSARNMAAAVRTLARLALKRQAGEPLDTPAADGYVPTGERVHTVAAENAAERAVTMLLRKARGEPFETEWAVPQYGEVPPAAPVADLARAKVALVTTGGVVPRDNPDRLESAYASKWLRYSIANVDELAPAAWESVHGGFDTTNINRDPNRMAPLDALRALEREGAIGALHDQLYTTTGNTAAIPTMRRFGQEILRDLRDAGVEGVILTSA